MFGYNVTFTLTPSNGVNTASVLTATAPNPGHVDARWYSPKPSNGDAINAFISPTIESTLREHGRRQGDTDREQRGARRATT